MDSENCFIKSFVKQRRKRLVNYKAEERINKSLAECERQIKNKQAFQQTVGRRQYKLVCPDYRIKRHAINNDIGRIDNEVVQRNADRCHRKSTENRAQRGSTAVFMRFIDKSGRKHKHRAHKEVCKLANTGAAAERNMDKVFDKLNSRAINRAKRECAKQRRKVTEIKLYKAWNERYGNLDKLEHYCDCGKHCCHRYLVGLCLGF